MLTGSMLVSSNLKTCAFDVSCLDCGNLQTGMSLFITSVNCSSLKFLSIFLKTFVKMASSINEEQQTEQQYEYWLSVIS